MVEAQERLRARWRQRASSERYDLQVGGGIPAGEGRSGTSDPPVKGFREQAAVEMKGFAAPIPVISYVHPRG